MSSIERSRSTRIPSRSVAVEGMIWASPAAESGDGPAVTSGRPADSRKITASRTSGSTTVAPGGLLDRVAELVGALGRGDDAARAHLVDHVRGAERGAALERVAAVGAPGERVRARSGRLPSRSRRSSSRSRSASRGRAAPGARSRAAARSPRSRRPRARSAPRRRGRGPALPALASVFHRRRILGGAASGSGKSRRRDASRRDRVPAVRTEARFPAVGAGAGHYESFYIKATRPGGGARRVDPPHRASASGRAANRVGLVHALRRRARRPAGDEAHRRRRRGLGADRRLHPKSTARCSSPAAPGPSSRPTRRGSPGTSSSSPRRRRSATSPTASSTARRCRGRSCSRRIPTPATGAR